MIPGQILKGWTWWARKTQLLLSRPLLMSGFGRSRGPAGAGSLLLPPAFGQAEGSVSFTVYARLMEERGEGS